MAAPEAGAASSGGAEAHDATRSWWIAALLVAFAAMLRGFAWEHTAVMFNDGARFLRQAEQIATGRWDLAFAEPYHPLYAIATAAVGALAPAGTNLENVAAAVSIVAGSVAVGCLYWFLRGAFGAPYDWLGALLFATHARAIQFSSDVQSEGLYFLVFTAALVLAWRALDRASVGYALAAGLMASLAYWTRPEGLLVALATGVAAPWWAWRRGWGGSLWLRWSIALAVAIAVGVGAYVGAVGAATGDWSFTRKKPFPLARSAPDFHDVSVGDAGGPRTAAPLPMPALPAIRTLRPRRAKALDAALDDLWHTTRSAARPLLLGALLLAIFFGLRAGGRGGWLRGGWLAALTLSYFAVLLWLLLSAGYVSRRHILPPLLPLFGYAAIGLHTLWASGLRRFPQLARWPRAAPVALAAILTLPFETEPRRIDKLAEKQASQWLAALPVAKPRETVAGVGGRVGFYARRPMIDVRTVEAAALADVLRAEGVRFAVFDDGDAIRALEQSPGFHSIHTATAAANRAVVFERAPEVSD